MEGACRTRAPRYALGMAKFFTVVLLSLSLAACGGKVEGASASPDAAPAKAEGGCCSGCSDEKPAAKGDACCGDEKPAAKGDACCGDEKPAAKGEGCCSEGLAVPPAEAKKTGTN